MQSKTMLGEISVPSTELEEVVLRDFAGSVTIRFEYELDDRLVSGGIEFQGIRAYRRRAESHCTKWHIADAYDTLVEVENSEWVAELLAAMQPDMRDMFEMHHYMIYLDSVGCYEVVAASWRFLPETPVGEE